MISAPCPPIPLFWSVRRMPGRQETRIFQLLRPRAKSLPLWQEREGSNLHPFGYQPSAPPVVLRSHISFTVYCPSCITESGQGPAFRNRLPAGTADIPEAFGKINHRLHPQATAAAPTYRAVFYFSARPFLRAPRLFFRPLAHIFSNLFARVKFFFIATEKYAPVICAKATPCFFLLRTQHSGSSNAAPALLLSRTHRFIYYNIIIYIFNLKYNLTHKQKVIYYL